MNKKLIIAILASVVMSGSFFVFPTLHVSGATGNSTVVSGKYDSTKPPGSNPWWWPIVPCGLNSQPDGASLLDSKNGPVHDYTQPCNQCLLILLGKNIVDMVFFVVVPVVGTFLFILGGFWIFLGAANPKLISKGKSIFWNTAIGIVIILSSWLITNFILKSLTGTDQSTSSNWYTLTCSTGTLQDIVNKTNPSLPTIGGPPVVIGAPAQPGTGVICKDTGQNLCQGTLGLSGCGESTPACQQYAAAAKQNAGGPITAEFLKSIIVTESTCNPRANSGQAYGLVQMEVGTANQFRQYCGITNNIDQSWLTNPANAEKEVCIATQYLKSLAAPNSCGTNIQNIVAGYNGGPKACQPSVDCVGEQSCTDGAPKRKWECLYDDLAHTDCNAGFSSYQQSRDYARNILYCVQNPGF